jgi:hypothetical protein
MRTNIEVFRHPEDYDLSEKTFPSNRNHEDEYEPGWYYWSCQPGCIPDSEAVGPFDSEAEAHNDAAGYAEPEYEHEDKIYPRSKYSEYYPD